MTSIEKKAPNCPYCEMDVTKKLGHCEAPFEHCEVFHCALCNKNFPMERLG